jgi:hypothetical protein
MKTAIYIEDGIVQLVITPESEFEKNALNSFNDKPLDAKIFNGTFYDCRGGWTRQSEYRADFYAGAAGLNKEERSLILRVDTSAKSD